jgi:hypothetical protein
MLAALRSNYSIGKGHVQYRDDGVLEQLGP